MTSGHDCAKRASAMAHRMTKERGDAVNTSAHEGEFPHRWETYRAFAVTVSAPHGTLRSGEGRSLEYLLAIRKSLVSKCQAPHGIPTINPVASTPRRRRTLRVANAVQLISSKNPTASAPAMLESTSGARSLTVMTLGRNAGEARDSTR